MVTEERLSENPVHGITGEKCPECGAPLIRDGFTGEVVCSECGVVVNEVEYAPQFVGQPRRGSFNLTSFAKTTGRPRISDVRNLGADKARYLRMLGRLDGRERTEMALATAVSTIANRIGMPKYVEEQAMWYGERLLKGMRETCKRLTVDEISAVAIWHACKVQGFVITMKEYASALNWKEKASLLKLITKANRIVPVPSGVFTALHYIGRVVNRLGSAADHEYLSLLETYARTLCNSVEDGELSGKDPVCVAATALCVADEILGGWVGTERIVEVLGAGYSQTLARRFKDNAPLPPKTVRGAAFRLLKKRAMEVIAYENVSVAH